MTFLKDNLHSASANEQPSLVKGILQRGVQVVGGLLLYGVILFLAAGRFDWTAAWIYLAINAAMIIVNSAILLRRDPAFIAARGQVRENVKEWDRQVTALAGILMIFSLLVPGLDARFGWSAPFAAALQIAGFIVLVLGYALFSWAMISNRFFETTVRLQTDRGQTVATGGPYSYVRHPGYAGMILQLLGTPFALGSWWGLLPGVGAAAAFIARTALEDGTLQQELAGYREYAQRIRYRLLPGVW